MMLARRSLSALSTAAAQAHGVSSLSVVAQNCCRVSSARPLQRSPQRRAFNAPAGGSSGSSPSSSSSSANASASRYATSSGAAAKPPKRPITGAAAYQRQRRTEWGVIAVAGSAAALSGWWYWYRIRPSRAEASAAAATPASRSFSSSSRTRFSIASRSSGDGSMPVYKIITSLTPPEVDRVLRANENSTTVDRPSSTCAVARYDTNSVASNYPIEDKRAEVIVERDTPAYLPASSAGGAAAGAASPVPVPGDLCFFAVMDGHAGYATSTLLSQKLIAFVALELDKVFREKGEYAKIAQAKRATPGGVWSAIFGGNAPLPGSQEASAGLGAAVGKALGLKAASGGKDAAGESHAALPSASLDADPLIIKRAIARAFKGLDKEICNTPIELLKEYEISLAAAKSHAAGSGRSGGGVDSPAAPSRVVTASNNSGGSPVTGTRSLSSLASSIFPSASSSDHLLATLTETQRKTAYEAILPALSGSCALLTYIDSARGDMYVACTGDSRAIAGWWMESEGRWEIEQLSIDQTGRNESEARRMRSEHPASEASTVIMRGRVLGGLEPTRAFGDARYKWDRALQERLYDAFLPGGRAGARPPPKYLATPPYVTAEPVVEMRKISTRGADATGAVSQAAASASANRQLKFVVMATDGLWDMMSNEEVGALVAGHLAGLKGDVLASALQSQCFASHPRAPTKGGSSAEAPPQVLPPPGSPRAGAKPSGEVSAATALSQQIEQRDRERDARGHPLNQAPQHLKTFTFEDANISTHLIRNALGGAQRERVAGLLAIPSPESRRYRDDITVNVILFADQQSGVAQGGEKPVKAKL